MPAGNDAKAAASELADQFGEGLGAAEALIQASRERYAGALGQAQLKEVDKGKTDELRESGYGDLAKTAGLKEKQIEDAAVRGDYVVYVFVDDDGRSDKGAFPLEALGKSPKTAEKAEAEAEDDTRSGGSRSGTRAKSTGK